MNVVIKQLNKNQVRPPPPRHPCCKSERFVPDPNFSIPDPGSKRFRIRVKDSSIFIPKIVSKLSEIWSGMFIPDPGSWILPIQDRGSKRQRIPDPQHCWAPSYYNMMVLITWIMFKCSFLSLANFFCVLVYCITRVITRREYCSKSSGRKPNNNSHDLLFW